MLCQTGFIIALSSTSAVAVFIWIFNLPIDLQLLIIVFTITMGSYTLDRLVDAKKERGNITDKNRYFIIYFNLISLFTGFLLFVGIFLAFGRSLVFGAMAMLAPIIVYIYSYEIKDNTLSIKKLHYTKDLVIAAGWSALILVVVVYYNLTITLALLAFSLGIFGKFYVMGALYDFKDVDSDLENGILTLPNTLSERGAKNVLYVINTLSTIWLLLLIYYGLISPLGFIFFPAWVYQNLLIFFVSKDAPLNFYYFPCDLEQVVWLLFAVPLVML